MPPEDRGSHVGGGRFAHNLVCCSLITPTFYIFQIVNLGGVQGVFPRADAGFAGLTAQLVRILQFFSVLSS